MSVPPELRLASGRRRRRSREGERGATMFIVLMIIVILSAIGTWALGNSRYEVRTAGYLRQRNVSETISGLGARAAMSEIGTAPKAYIDRLRATPTTGEKCDANGGLGATGPTSALPPCYHVYLQDVQNRTGTILFQVPVVSAPGVPGIPGSLGMSGMSGGFVVEFTDPIEVVRAKPGEPIDGSAGTPKFLDVTISVTGVVFQDDPGGVMGVIDASERPTATFTGGRGHMLVGPIY